MILKISSNIDNIVVEIQKFQIFMCNTSKDIISYFSTVASEDPVEKYLIAWSK